MVTAGCLSVGLLACSGNQTPVQGGGESQFSGTETAGKDSVIVAVSSEPENGLDPCLGWGHGTAPLVQSALVKYTQDMQIENDLATAYTVSEDGTQWTFTLRADAFFTDGEPVTAKDVAFTFKTAKENKSSLDLTSVKDVQAIENQVRFTLVSPNASFLYNIAAVGIVPAHAYSADYMDHPIGSGPWKFVQWNRGEQIILEANQDYYGEVPAIKQVTIVFMREDAALLAAQAGQVDVALVSATQAGNEIAGMRLESVTTMDNRGMTLPMSPAEGKTTESGDVIGNDVTSQISIRHALAYAMDRDTIAADAVNGYADPAYSENDGMPWNNPDVKIAADKEKAKEILQADGWTDTDGDGIVEKNGLKASFTCMYPSGDSVRQAVAIAAAAQAKEVGIEILVEGVSWDEISRKMFSNAVLMGWGATDPYTSYLLFHSDFTLKDDYYNPEGYSNAAVDGYLENALQASDAETANQFWKKAQWDGSTGTSMLGDCPWVWLVNIQHLYFVREGLDIGTQQKHAHGASWTLLQNLSDWKWTA